MTNSEDDVFRSSLSADYLEVIHNRRQYNNDCADLGGRCLYRYENSG
jgi:hypothetical protein